MPLLSARHITLGYTHQGSLTTILQDFSLDVAEGELIGLMGPSGVGKSSLLRVLAGLAKPLKGEVQLFGKTLTRPHPRLGFVFQQAVLLPWLNVRDNVSFGLDFKSQPELGRAARRARVEEAIEEVGLSHAAEMFPAELSGGMAQRVSLARALARNPEIIYLDEPFSALDAITRESMQDLLVALAHQQKSAALLVTHDIDEALRIGDRVLLLAGSPARIVGEWRPSGTAPRQHRSSDLNAMREDILNALSSPEAAWYPIL